MKVLILGAGATAYSSHANKDRRPPTSKDGFLRMFTELILHRPSVESHDKHVFIEGIELHDNDIEAFFTTLYSLSDEELCKKMTQPDEVLKRKKLQVIINKYCPNNPVTYANLRTLFSGILRDEIQGCIGTTSNPPYYLNRDNNKSPWPPEMPICRWHRAIAKTLTKEDVVINFNYDSIMAYALLNENKLSRNSFINTYIEFVDMPEKHISGEHIYLFTPHGSFTWYRKMTKYISSKITIGLNNSPPKECTSDPVILPLKIKQNILQKIPHLKEETEASLNVIKEAEEIYLIGKQFKSSDTDWAEEIKKVCSQGKQKLITYANPDSTEKSWIEHHNDIFNSKNKVCFSSVEELANAILAGKKF